MQNKSFLKWAGGKYRMVPTLLANLPITPNSRLIEPFVGAGSLFLNTECAEYVLCDNNPDLINLYSQIIKGGDKFIAYCRKLFIGGNAETVYYEKRELFNTTKAPRLKAALFLYLNRHGFNGLCRYSAKGRFNTPFGKYDTIYFPEKEMRHLAEKSKKSKITLLCDDFSAAFAVISASPRASDVVYCDPPYVPLDGKDSFTGYTPLPFSVDEHKRLVVEVKKATKAGAFVGISNSDTPFTKKIYTDFKLLEVNASRTISSVGAHRKKLKELLALVPPAT